ncbi:DUF3179 domain-containing protein [Cytophagaceae bacterium AH-315-L13]|nr:DUF3179 domain-containing protein [Cytophagaceae bacterium AH-315-L13]
MKKYLISTQTLLLAIIFICYMLGTTACKKDKDSDNDSNDSWSIPEDEVYDGGPGKDGIPSIDSPEFVSFDAIDYLEDDDLVLGIKSGNTIRAYPHPILDWHEIINDDVNGIKLSVTYCPLTGSGIGWDRNVDGSTTTFGVSGLLYNSNLIPYDRETDSNWSQMKLESVNGSLKGTIPSVIMLVETTWKTWKEMYSNTAVMSITTGYTRSYGTYPYGSYKTNNDNLLFPISNDDSRLPQKERVHGIIAGDKQRAYQFVLFSDSTQTINDNLNNIPVVIIGNESKNFILSFERKIGDSTLTFLPVQTSLPDVMIDNEGTTWDVFGVATSGPRAGEQLTPTKSFIAYWFAWGTFYPDIEIYNVN